MKFFEIKLELEKWPINYFSPTKRTLHDFPFSSTLFCLSFLILLPLFFCILKMGHRGWGTYIVTWIQSHQIQQFLQIWFRPYFEWKFCNRFTLGGRGNEVSKFWYEKKRPNHLDIHLNIRNSNTNRNAVRNISQTSLTALMVYYTTSV